MTTINGTAMVSPIAVTIIFRHFRSNFVESIFTDN